MPNIKQVMGLLTKSASMISCLVGTTSRLLATVTTKQFRSETFRRRSPKINHMKSMSSLWIALVSVRSLRFSPWILDEPSGFWDYRALQFYGELTDRGRGVAPDVPINYRIDISRPEYCRGQLDRRDDLWIVSSSAFQDYRRLVSDRMQSDGLKAWVYGTSNHVHETNRNIQAWALDAWQDGATGIVPWQTVDKSGNAMKIADQLGLFIFDKDAAGETVIHAAKVFDCRMHGQRRAYSSSIPAAAS